MSKEDVLLFTCYGKKGSGKSYMEHLKAKDKEIERLNKELEFEKLKNKEVREYIETEYLSKFDDFEKPFILTDKNDWNKVLEILDKEEE